MSIDLKNYKNDVEDYKSIYYLALNTLQNGNINLEHLSNSRYSMSNVFNSLTHNVDIPYSFKYLSKSTFEKKSFTPFFIGMNGNTKEPSICNVFTPLYSEKNSYIMYDILAPIKSILYSIYGFYPGNAEAVVFTTNTNVTIPDIPADLIKDFVKLDKSNMLYTGGFLAFKTLNHAFFSAIKSVTFYNNTSLALSNLNPDLYEYSRIKILLDSFYNSSASGYSSSTSYYGINTKMLYFRNNSATARTDFESHLKSNLTETKSPFYVNNLDDLSGMIEPYLIILSDSKYQIVAIPDGIPDIDKRNIHDNYESGKLVAIYLGSYCTFTSVFTNKTYLDSKKYVYTTNSNGTYTVNSNDNIDKLGVLFILDEANYPLSLSVNKIKDVKYFDVITRKKYIINYCNSNKIHNPYILPTKIENEKQYEIGTMGLSSNPTVTDVPSMLSKLDIY